MPDAPPELLGEKEYKVVGPHPVWGTEPGGVISLNLTAEQEDFYVGGGHLKVCKPSKKEVSDG